MKHIWHLLRYMTLENSSLRVLKIDSPSTRRQIQAYMLYSVRASAPRRLLKPALASSTARPHPHRKTATCKAVFGELRVTRAAEDVLQLARSAIFWDQTSVVALSKWVAPPACAYQKRDRARSQSCARKISQDLDLASVDAAWRIPHVLSPRLLLKTH